MNDALEQESLPDNNDWLTLLMTGGPVKTIEFSRVWAMPNKNTFQIPPIRELIAEVIRGLPEGSIILDPFSNNSPFKAVCITNDIDPACQTDYHLDALEFLKTFGDKSADCVLFDPPYSPRQISECYKKLGMSVNMETTQASFWSRLKAEIQRVVKPNGVVISFGWNSGGGWQEVWVLLGEGVISASRWCPQ